MWSFGVTVIELWNEGSPFQQVDSVGLIQAIRDRAVSPTSNKDIPADLDELSKACFTKDPNKRITISEIRERLVRMVEVLDISSSGEEASSASSDYF